MEQWFDLPDRKPDAPTGSALVAEWEILTVGDPPRSLGHSEERDRLIEEQVLAGNVPEFMRIVHAVKLGERATIYSMPDYLPVGSDEDHVIVELNPMTAQRICDAVGASLPTRKMVDAIWKAAEVKLDPQPWGPPYDASMMSTYRMGEHNRRIQEQFKAKGGELGKLVAGHKKDVVLAIAVESPRDAKVAIYGWHQSNGKPIQGPGIQATAHEITYRDYAHGIRLVSCICMVDGKEMLVTDVLKNPDLVSLLSDEMAGNTGVVTTTADKFITAKYVTSLNVA